MSIQKTSVEPFTRFFNRLYKMLHSNSKLGTEFCSEAAPAASSNTSTGSTGAVPVLPRDLRSRRAATTKELERYYAKPGSAEYGC